MSQSLPPIPPDPRDQALEKLASAGHKLARHKRPDPVKQELLLMLTAIVTRLPLDNSDLKQAESWLSCILHQEPLPRDEMVVWSVDLLKEAVTATPDIDSPIKNRTHRLIDAFQTADLVPSLVGVYVDLTKSMDFDKAYSRLTRTASPQLVSSFKRQLNEALSDRPRVREVVEVLTDLASILLGQDSAVELITQIRNGTLSSMKDLAKRYRHSEALHMHSDRLRSAVIALKDEEAREAEQRRSNEAAVTAKKLREAKARGTHSSAGLMSAGSNSL